MNDNNVGFYLENEATKAEDVVTPRIVRTGLCQESLLIEDGVFFLPDGINNGRQIYRKVTTEYDGVSHKRVLVVSSSYYYNDGGKFVVGGVDAE